MSTMRSIRGRGKLSFGQALLMSVKSMQSRHLPFAFLSRTTLANHSGYSTFLIAFAWRSLPTSSLIAFCLSRAKLLFFCLTGLKDGLTFSLWVITTGSIPPMSSCFQANTSMFCFRKQMRCFGWSPSYTGPNSFEGDGRVLTSSHMCKTRENPIFSKRAKS